MLLKSGTTLYRFARYYTGAPAYTAKGPPHPLLRVIGPFVILSSLALLGTGVGLIFLGTNGSGWLLTAHQTCFWIWVALMTVHVRRSPVGGRCHLVDRAARLAAWPSRTSQAVAVRGDRDGAGDRGRRGDHAAADRRALDQPAGRAQLQPRPGPALTSLPGADMTRPAVRRRATITA